ncbi:MAG: hypothetical protein P1U36_10125 [Legionellaceae bacterium]|nr:hypothetical protein [Legionellaceae bacterium]
MPDLKDIVSTREKKKFVKSAYRPWDLTGSHSDENTEKEIIDNIKETKQKPIKQNEVLHDEPKKITASQQNVAPNSSTRVQEKNISNEVGAASIELKLTNLAGLQKKILSIITKACSEDDLKTGPIHTKVLAENINASIGSTKMSISRLIAKGLITREKGRPAKDGFIILRVNKEVHEILLQQNERDRLL